MDLKQLYALMERFEKTALSELTWKKEGEEVTLKKGAEPPAPAPAFLAAAAPASSSAAGAAPVHQLSQSPSRGSDIEVIRAPIVGTFYRSPAPDAAAFVEKGDRVKKGQTLCILEAMKLMNEFQAEYDLEVIAILVDNGTMVEFGSPLFEVRRT
jgi:acetyl-CoA carboxylase biotin carboxyl carrier protein